MHVGNTGYCLLGWHYGTNFSKTFQQFSNHFSILIIHAKVVFHSGLLKRTEMYSFFEIFQAPKQYLNLQQFKSRQNRLKISYIDCIWGSQTNSAINFLSPMSINFPLRESIKLENFHIPILKFEVFDIRKDYSLNIQNIRKIHFLCFSIQGLWGKSLTIYMSVSIGPLFSMIE